MPKLFQAGAQLIQNAGPVGRPITQFARAAVEPEEEFEEEEEEEEAEPVPVVMVAPRQAIRIMEPREIGGRGER